MSNNFSDDAARRLVKGLKQNEANKPGMFGFQQVAAPYIPIMRGKITETITARSSGLVAGPGITEWIPGAGKAKFYEYDAERNRFRLGDEVSIKNDYPYTFPNNAEAFFHLRNGVNWIDGSTCSGLP